MREVNLRQLDAARADVFPHVGLGPVGDGEHAHVFARELFAVVEIPQLGALSARVPAAEGVADREDTLLRPRPLLVAARPAKHGVVADLGDSFDQRHGLQRVAGAVRALHEVPAVDPVLHLGDAQPHPVLGDDGVAELDDLREVVARVNVQQLNRHRRGRERAARQLQHHARVLAAGEQQPDLVKLPRHLAQDMDGLVFQVLEVGRDAARVCRNIHVHSNSHL